MSKLSVTFCGAARTVTGSLYLLEYIDSSNNPFRFILDAGMFQVGGRANLYRINSHLVFDPKTVDAIVLTHGHLDHCGRIPYLFKMGFNGPIYCTRATSEIAQVVMEDSARMQKDDEGKLPQEYLDIDYFQKEEYKKKFVTNEKSDGQLDTIIKKMDEGEGYLRLYSDVDVAAAVAKFEFNEYHEKFKIHPEIELEFYDAGHILGSAYVVFNFLKENKKVVFSGDLGNLDKPIIEDPEMPPKIDNLAAVFTETTYGNKVHGVKQPKLKLSEAVNPILKSNGGKVLIPSFSVERAQEIIYFLYELMEEKKIPYVPVYLDSPMANKVLDICVEHQELYDDEMDEKIRTKKNPFKWNNLKILESKQESLSLHKMDKACIIIAGSGMLTGGRMLDHLYFNIENPNNLLMFCGYQAEGTLGRKLMDGISEIKLNDRLFKPAIQITNITEFSAHADRLTLHKWLGDLYNGHDDATLFLMHGEADAVKFYQDEINRDIPNIKTYWPKFAETVVIFGGE
jgi:metallo-beta-lactamase family protein